MSAGGVVEGLEGRRLFAVEVLGVIGDVRVVSGSTAQGEIELSQYFGDAGVPGDVVFINMDLGVIPVRLEPGAVPGTVGNFLNYVNSGRYNNTIIHRKEVGWVIQGGGFLARAGLDRIVTDAPILNEFESRPFNNVRGTIAMAKTSDPNSATSQWFINLSDSNSAQLDDPNKSGGFTTFGEVIGSGMDVVDDVVELPDVDLFPGDPMDPFDPNHDDPFGHVPLTGMASGQQGATVANLVTVRSVTRGLSYAVVTDRPEVVQVGVWGGKLAYMPGGADGVANVTLTAAGLDGVKVERTFKVIVGPPAPVVTPPVEVPEASVTLGRGKSVVFKDGDGTNVTIALEGQGSLRVDFDGEGVTTKTVKGVTTVSGSGLRVMGMVVTGASAKKTVITVGTKGGNGAVDIADIEASGALGTLEGKGVNLVGDVEVGGVVTGVEVKGVSGGVWRVGRLGRLAAGTISGATIATTAGGLSMGVIEAKKIVDSEIRSGGNIGAVLVSSKVSGSRILAGVKGEGAVSMEEVVGGKGQILLARIGSGKRGNVFADSAMGAKVIKDAAFGNLVDAVSEKEFYGVKADTITKMVGFVGGKGFEIKNAGKAGEVEGQLKKGKVVLKNLRIEVV